MLCKACLANSWRKARKIRSGSATSSHRKAKGLGTCNKLAQEGKSARDTQKSLQKWAKELETCEKAQAEGENLIRLIKKAQKRLNKPKMPIISANKSNKRTKC